MSNPFPSLHPHGDQPVIAAESALADRKELAFVALERTRMPMVVSDPRLPDNPIVLANNAFLQQTGYAAGEVIGRNCRFLQGPDTEPRAVEIIRSAVAEEKPVTVELLNYRKDGRPFWNQLHISPIHDEAGQLSYFFASQMDVTATRKANDLEHAEHALLLEVDHRAKNALALVQGVVRLSRRDAGIEAYADAVLGRVDAIAVAHALLSDTRWRGVAVGRLVAGLTGALQGRVEVSGPAVLLSADQVQPLAIVLHELLTNAAQHGVLATRAGRCRIDWDVCDGNVAISIKEAGVARPVPGSTGDGFGKKIVEQVVRRQLRGAVVSEWQDDGLRTTVSVPVYA